MDATSRSETFIRSRAKTGDQEAYRDESGAAMRTICKSNADVVALRVFGILDASAAPLRNRIQTEVHSGCYGVILNLRGVTQIDVAGLGVLFDIFLAVRRLGIDLKLVGFHPRLDVLLIVKLSTVFDVCASEAEARGRLSTGRLSRAA